MPEPRSMLPAIEPEPRSQTDLEIGRDLASYKLLFQEAGLDPDTIDTRLLERFALLDEKTPVLDDERLMMQYADKVFDYCDRVDSENAMDVYGRRVVRLGTLLADIGKTGPLDATPEQQTLVTEMYAIDEPFDGNKSVTEYLETFFPNEYQARMETFKTLKLDPDMTMRDFWNMHAKWSFDLVSMGKAPDEIAYTAAMAGIKAITRQLAVQFTNSNVLINNIIYGHLENDEHIDKTTYIKRIPKGRMMNEDDLKKSIDLLLDSDSNYITGQNIVVDGGMSIW